MSSTNLGWLFYKDYFTAIDDWSEPKKSEKALAKKVDELIGYSIKIEQEEPLGNIHFKATTTYPGLILGSGYQHELKSVEAQASLGFDFDYTTGLPIIRGSSIKGVLRSAFKYPEYIQELLKDEDIDVKALEIEIFGQDNGNSNVSQGKDIFFDATIIKSVGSILADDYLAPHGDKLLKNPIPIRFIKVAPNVTFRFDFELSDGVISKKAKSKLFQEILNDFGVGAKTNVGYGKFEDISPFKTKEEEEVERLKLEKQKELERLKREEEQKRQQELKEEKAKGVEELKKCKDIKTAMKILNESLGKKPKPTAEQKSIIEEFWNRHKNRASKSELKFFKKFGL